MSALSTNVEPTTHAAATDPAVLRERLVKALTSRRARIQLVTGPLGSDASATLAGVASALREAGLQVVPIAGIPGLEGSPYGCLAPALASIAPDADTTEQALRRLFAAAAPARNRLVLIVDDAPSLDPESAGVVAQLVRIYGLSAIVAARTRRLLPSALAGLATEGLIDETPVGVSMPDVNLEQRLAATVVRTLDAQTPAAREFAEQLAALGVLPEACADSATADALEDAGLIVRDQGDVVRLPHEGFARIIRHRLPRGSATDAAELVALLRGFCDDSALLAEATRLAGYHRAVERRRPDEAVALGAGMIAAVPDVEPALARHLASWRSMEGVMAGQPAADDAAGPAQAMQAMVQGHQRIAAAMMHGDISGGRAAVRETRGLIEAASAAAAGAGAALDMGMLVADTGEYHLTALAGDVTSLAELEERARAAGPLSGLWEATIAYYRLRGSAEPHEALELARAAFGHLEWHEFFGTRAIAAGVWAVAAARLALTREAKHALGQLTREARPWSLVDLQAVEAEAWLLAAEGQQGRASELLTTVLSRAAENGYWGYGSVCAIAGIHFGHAADMLDFLHPAAEASPESLAPLVRNLAVAITDGDELGRTAAEARLRAAGFLPPAAPAEHEADGLSPREREIARAAANGASSREIGERLGLSHRTVETHLQNVYRKLGVASRRELSDAVTPRPTV